MTNFPGTLIFLHAPILTDTAVSTQLTATSVSLFKMHDLQRPSVLQLESTEKYHKADASDRVSAHEYKASNALTRGVNHKSNGHGRFMEGATCSLPNFSEECGDNAVEAQSRKGGFVNHGAATSLNLEANPAEGILLTVSTPSPPIKEPT